MKDQPELIAFIKHLTSGTGKIIRDYYRVPVNIETKADSSPVTIADKKAEEFLREAIMKEFPDHGILGEEIGEMNPKAEYKWVLDPIDGTKSFICGTPLFGTLIALVKNRQPILGAIHLPVLDELLIGDNSVTTLNDIKVNVRGCNNISDAVLLITDLKTFGPDITRGLNKLISKSRLVRSWGDCYGYYLVASGFADIMIDPIMSVWDKMALIPVINGAGGVITTMLGEDPLEGTSIIAAAKGIHLEVIRMINRV